MTTMNALWHVRGHDGSEVDVVAETMARAAEVASAWYEHESPSGVNPFEGHGLRSITYVTSVDAVAPEAGEPLAPKEVNAATAQVELVGVAVALSTHYLVGDTRCLARDRVGDVNYRIGDGGATHRLNPDLQKLENGLNRIRELDRERRR